MITAENRRILLNTVGEMEESPILNFYDFYNFFETSRERGEGGMAAEHT